MPCKGLRKNKRATSPAVSMVIITATTIVLVLVASSYAYQVLERQRGASEFDAVKKSFLTFDDAVRDVAWDKNGSRSARFTVNYGLLKLESSPINVTIVGYSNAHYYGQTAYLRYNLSTNYITLGDKYGSYILGDDKTVISESTENFGFALIEQRSSWVTLTLGYRVRAIRTMVVQVAGNPVNYVDVMIIKITAAERTTYIGDFDLVARNTAITTLPRGPYPVSGSACNVKVSLGGSSSEIPIILDSSEGAKVVFNFIIAEVQVST